MDKAEITSWLKETDATRLEELWDRADKVRKDTVGDAVHLRGLIEISNYCARRCAYCGINAANTSLQRYRMSEDEIMGCVENAVNFGYGTVVLQAGEDYGIKAEWLAAIIRKIKNRTSLAVTLSLGERLQEDMKLWRQAGADRYLLRFETSDRKLYDAIHPSLAGVKSDRIEILGGLRELGYEVGSGVMTGIPGQTYESLANDIDTFRSLDLDMIGVGPYISHPSTELGKQTLNRSDRQVHNSEEMVYKTVAISRIVCPQANIPATTALATINTATGREQALQCGANVVMPNLTPPNYRTLYEIYPAKACIYESADTCNVCLRKKIESMGRYVATGPGSRVKQKSNACNKGQL